MLCICYACLCCMRSAYTVEVYTICTAVYVTHVYVFAKIYAGIVRASKGVDEPHPCSRRCMDRWGRGGLPCTTLPGHVLTFSQLCSPYARLLFYLVYMDLVQHDGQSYFSILYSLWVAVRL